MSFFKKLFQRPASKDAVGLDGSFLFDPLDEAFIESPYPVLAYLRQKQPLHRARSGAWILTRHKDVKSALMDDRLGNAPSSFAVVNKRNRDKYLCAEVANHILPFLDPPLHTDSRDIVSKSFFQVTKHLSSKEDRSIDNRVAMALLDRLENRKRFDVIHDYGTPFSAEVICGLLGLPVADKLRLAGWAESFLYLFSSIPDPATLEKVNHDLSRFRQYCEQLIISKRKTPGEDWLSAAIAMNTSAGDRLTDVELIDNLMLLFADGVENVDRMLGTCVKLMADNPGLKQALIENEEMTGKFVDECLRFETPVQFIGRIGRQELELHGQWIAPDSVLLLMLGAANRDETVFPDADKFIIDRDNRETLSFGRGRHTCLGRALVKQQLVCALNVLLQRFPSFTVVDNSGRWEKRLAHRWLSGLEIATG